MEKTLNPVPNSCIYPGMLLGESVVRRIIEGKRNYYEKFGREPSLFFSSDSLGHSRGLVQLLVDSGYSTFLFYLPVSSHDSIPADTFEWIGFDGSRVTACGVSDKSETDTVRMEAYFSHLKENSRELTLFRKDLDPIAPGRYPSIRRFEHQLFTLEHKFYTAEKLLSLASVSEEADNCVERINLAMKEILFCRYNEVIPETTDGQEEEDIARIYRVSELIDGEVGSLLLNAGNSLETPSLGEYPVMIINPHPFNVVAVIEMRQDPLSCDTAGSGTMIVVNEKGEIVPSQYEKPESKKSHGQEKKIVFRASVPAGSTSRYSCFLKDIPATAVIPEPDFVFNTDKSKLVIDRKTGFPSSFEFSGKKLLGNESMNFSIVDENTEPVFSLLTDPVSISEDGPVRTILESFFECSNSSIHVRYILPKTEPYFDVEITVNPMGKEKILLWSIPVGYNMNCIGRSLSGINCSKQRKREYIFRDWLGMKNFDGEASLSICAEGAYGYEIAGNTVRISLLISPHYPENTFRFRLFPGNTDEVIDRSFNNSDLFNNPLIARFVYPSGAEGQPFSGIRISDPSINLQAARRKDDGDLVLRLLNPCRETKQFMIEVQAFSLSAVIEIGSKQLKTLVVEKQSGRFIETDLTGRVII